MNDMVTVLVDSSERAEEIDLERAKRAQARAEEALKRLSQEEKEYKEMEVRPAKGADQDAGGGKGCQEIDI